MGILSRATITALFLGAAGCGARTQGERERAAMNAQLESINAATPEAAGAEPPKRDLLTPTPDQIGQQMRAAAAKPGPHP